MNNPALSQYASAGASLGQAWGAYQEGQATAQGFEYNSTISKGDIDINNAMRVVERKREARQLKSLLGQQHGIYAKGNVELSGSALDVMRDTIYQSELDSILRDVNVSIANSRLQSDIEMNAIRARSARKLGIARAISNVGQAAGSYSKALSVSNKKNTIPSTSGNGSLASDASAYIANRGKGYDF